jgi:predicted nucleic acid-binding Zn ribbon protein
MNILRLQHEDFIRIGLDKISALDTMSWGYSLVAKDKFGIPQNKYLRSCKDCGYKFKDGDRFYVAFGYKQKNLVLCEECKENVRKLIEAHNNVSLN